MSTTERRPGLFVTFEGLDGSGKSTQLRLLAQRLRAAGRTVLETAEPGGTDIGRQIRRVLLDARNQALSPVAELLLYFACRAQNVDESILPALRQGSIVLSDRFTDSTLVYQGAGRGLGEDLVMVLDHIACRGLQPDLTIFLDIDLEASLQRARSRNDAGANEETRMDEQARDFHARVSHAYAGLIARHPQRFRVVDGRGDVEIVAARVWQAVQGAVSAHDR